MYILNDLLNFFLRLAVLFKVFPSLLEYVLASEAGVGMDISFPNC